jgi:hypothetical protein
MVNFNPDHDGTTGLPKVHVPELTGVLYMAGICRSIRCFMWRRKMAASGAGMPTVVMSRLDSALLMQLKVFWAKGRKPLTWGALQVV